MFDETNASYVIEVRRIRGIFLENLELENFPFDVQDLTITIGSDRSDEEIILVDDEEEPHSVTTQVYKLYGICPVC